MYDQRNKSNYSNNAGYRFPLEKLPEWLKNGINPDAVKTAEEFGKKLAIGFHNQNSNWSKGISSSQIRKLFNEIKEIEMILGNNPGKWTDLQARILMLKPKMAYSAKRENKKEAKELSKFVDKCINIITEAETNDVKINHFRNFSLFFEAVLAYHRANEKK